MNPSTSQNALQKSPPKIANLSYNSDDADSNAQYAMMEVDHKKKIKEISDEFDEMIRFMDTSFEKAFDKKEKDFMLAYRTHLSQIQTEIETLKSDGNNDKYVAIKQ